MCIACEGEKQREVTGRRNVEKHFSAFFYVKKGHNPKGHVQ